MSKRHILAAVTEVAGEGKAQAWAGLKKDALVELAEPVLTEARWLPEPLHTVPGFHPAQPGGAERSSPEGPRRPHTA